MITEEHVTPDGLLRLVVDETDGDTTLGFAGYGWHTHAGILAAVSGLSEAAAVRQFVRSVLQNEATIAISRVGGRIQGVWITEDPAAEMRYVAADETIEFRRWDGRPPEPA